MQNTVLLTGATGFLGAYILEQLVLNGYVVKALRRSNTLPSFINKKILDGVVWVDADILDVVAIEEAMQDVDIVIHAAAIVSFHKKDKATMRHVNVSGTANMVNLALQNNVKRFVYISSVAALGRVANGTTVTEEKKWDDNASQTNYAKSKHLAELEVWRGIAEGLNAIILNPATILGFGDWNKSSCTIFKTVYNSFKWYSTGSNSFVDVEDVAKITLQLMESNISEERFIISSQTISFKQLMYWMAEGFGSKPPSKQISRFLASLAWRAEAIKYFFTRKKSTLTKESVKVAMSNTSFDNSKIVKTLPDFRFLPIEQSVKNSCEKYLDQLRSS